MENKIYRLVIYPIVFTFIWGGLYNFATESLAPNGNSSPLSSILGYFMSSPSQYGWVSEMHFLNDFNSFILGGFFFGYYYGLVTKVISLRRIDGSLMIIGVIFLVKFIMVSLLASTIGLLGYLLDILILSLVHCVKKLRKTSATQNYIVK
ncbi:hypothetical protein ACQCVK_04325 [Rossellomorea vietnamensis]|uniref:hypothetical protein n=1 Tax=Rossellomorea vietnamensis TaxID=218284 RepID=UPI003CEDB447